MFTLFISILAFVSGCVLTALALHLKPHTALEANYDYLKRHYKTLTGKDPPTAP